MPGRSSANKSGSNLEKRVVELASKLGLSTKKQVRAGHRLWGKGRRIDVVVYDKKSGKSLGIECKAQNQPGTAEEKLPATIQDIQSWPIPGIVVLDGKGFSEEIKAFLFSTGKAVLLDELEDWLRLYFGLHDE
ncbi:MAG: hypothetical protein KatS3mg038_3052 [Candidatus Kapaibacterium sp.]|nr:MAG: hypothetical protein KatS3mg038_3052 [Candidatus Kapabacteria bacterium]GIV55684.1 MAG: hypothetical protein KatS3mg040_0452 [Candidatus Kapabacteria bacterium]